MSVSNFRTESIVELITGIVLFAVVILAGVLLFTPYEAFIEGFVAFLMIGFVIAGFLMHPRREVFYVRTAVRIVDADRNQALEKDFLAVKVELARLWLLFAPTLLAVACLAFFAAGGPTKFSYFNWLFSSKNTLLALFSVQYPSIFVLILLSAWVSERRVMRDAEACSARSFSIAGGQRFGIGRVSYLFMGERAEYCGGYSYYFGLIRSQELATIVFYNVRKPEINKIAMGFLFHRLIILGRGIKDLDEQTTAANMALAEITSQS